MPFAKNKRRSWRHHDREGGQRPPLAQRSGKMAGVVLALDRPAEGEAAAGKPRERALEVGIYTSAPRVEHRGSERQPGGHKPLALGPAPRFEAVGIHLGRKRSFMILKVFRNCAAAAACFLDRKSTRLNSSHLGISYAVFCL